MKIPLRSQTYLVILAGVVVLALTGMIYFLSQSGNIFCAKILASLELVFLLLLLLAFPLYIKQKQYSWVSKGWVIFFILFSFAILLSSIASIIPEYFPNIVVGTSIFLSPGQAITYGILYLFQVGVSYATPVQLYLGLTILVAFWLGGFIYFGIILDMMSTKKSLLSRIGAILRR